MAGKKKQNDFNKSDFYINRELSWLEFNGRVLDVGLDENMPLLERLKFMAIFSSNLDEFYMIRAAGLMQQVYAGRRKRDSSGLTPAKQLKLIAEKTHEMVRDQNEGIKKILAALPEHGLNIMMRNQWTLEQRSLLKNYFNTELMPVLTPMSFDDLVSTPVLSGRALNVAVLIDSEKNKNGQNKQDKQPVHNGEKVAVIPVPGNFPRFVNLPLDDGVWLACIEDVIADNAATLYPNRRILGTTVFRYTRDADVEIQEDEAGDLLSSVEQAVQARLRRSVVRLEISAGAPGTIKDKVLEWSGTAAEHVYEIDGVLDCTAMMSVAMQSGFEQLKIPEWTPQTPRDLLESDDLYETVSERDILIFLPFESFDPVVELAERAAEDPNVLAIKQTLYRTSGDSPIIAALENAAENGKSVTVLVELKARFDEERNVGWARRLEDAGCTVIYGVAGLKTHSKALLIVRREGGRIQRYVHLSTGNYNDKTARLYSDIGMMTTDRILATDVSSMFNLMTGASEAAGMSKLCIAPTGLRKKIYELIDREIMASTADRPGLIMAKMNSLEDKGVISELYRASCAGVRILLNVRGICCLRPGVKGVSENIEVISIVDRFLEHARIFYFNNGGHEEVYLSSADWMNRNLDKRIETMFPVSEPRLIKRLRHILEVYFSDNVKATRLKNDGSYEKIRAKGSEQVRSQEVLFNEAVEAVESARRTKQRFRPHTQPGKK